jgi:hypothetical protein
VEETQNLPRQSGLFRGDRIAFVSLILCNSVFYGNRWRGLKRGLFRIPKGSQALSSQSSSLSLSKTRVQKRLSSRMLSKSDIPLVNLRKVFDLIFCTSTPELDQNTFSCDIILDFLQYGFTEDWEHEAPNLKDHPNWNTLPLLDEQRYDRTYQR